MLWVTVNKEVLASGESDTIQYSYTVTQTDVDRGEIIHNCVTVTGIAPDGHTVEADDVEEIEPEPGMPCLSVELKESPEQEVKAGEKINIP